MNQYIEDLKQTDLFSGIDPDDIEGLLGCLGAKRVDYAKGEHIIEEGDLVFDFGILLSGHGRTVKWDLSGRMIIISLLKKGSEIGVVLAADSDHRSPVTVLAQDEVSVLRIPFTRVLSRCGQACPRHDILLRNYISIVAKKGLILHERIDCMVCPTIREKVLNYLLRISRGQQKKIFTVPMNRNDMAEYLNVERSALSRELSNMKRDGILDYHKNSFRLYV